MLALLPVHVASGNNSDQAIFTAQSESNIQTPAVACAPQRVKPSLGNAVTAIFRQKQRLVHEHLLGLRLTDAMLFSAFPSVAMIPVKTDDAVEVNHNCISWSYTLQVCVTFDSWNLSVSRYRASAFIAPSSPSSVSGNIRPPISPEIWRIDWV